jgi:hypothetical protein
LLPSHHWAHDFTVQSDDIDYLMNLLLEKETPLTSQQLARILIEKRLAEEAAAIKERFKDARIYNPAHSYKVGHRVVFSTSDYNAALVTAIRPGENSEYGEFNVITVDFEDDDQRDFATDFKPEHALTTEVGDVSDLIMNLDDLTADNIMDEMGKRIITTMEERLKENDSLTSVSGQWFPRDLVLEPNDGHINLAEAVLDMAHGGPLPTEVILEQIGGIGDYPMSLQTFSLNYSLNQNGNFTEVGPAGEILWYLSRMTEAEVKEPPSCLQYTPVDYDRALLTEEMLTLEAEISDELSPLPATEATTKGTITLTYPHRRSGTLPLSANVRHIFPFARTSHIWIILVDEQDGQEYTGWVIPESKYIFGLEPLYEKYQIPIGAYVTVSKGETPDRVNIRFNTYKARIEWVRLMETRDDQFHFEEKQRSIGADYDDLMILGIDDLEAMDEVIVKARKQKTLVGLLRMLLPGLGHMTPQGTAHFSTIYSAVNVVRRYPPGPIMVTLETNPDFEYVGGNYWKLGE